MAALVIALIRLAIIATLALIGFTTVWVTAATTATRLSTTYTPLASPPPTISPKVTPIRNPHSYLYEISLLKNTTIDPPPLKEHTAHEIALLLHTKREVLSHHKKKRG